MTARTSRSTTGSSRRQLGPIGRATIDPQLAATPRKTIDEDRSRESTEQLSEHLGLFAAGCATTPGRSYRSDPLCLRYRSTALSVSSTSSAARLVRLPDAASASTTERW